MFASRKFFSAEQVKQIEAAIRAAEEHTSGEIRVHIEERCNNDPLQRAASIFRQLDMHTTLMRNGILFFLAPKDKKFSVFGDEGIHKHVPAGFWDSVRDTMLQKFQEEQFADGLCAGITMTGAELKKFFPVSDTDKNELANEVTFGRQ